MTTHELTSAGRGHYGPDWPQRVIIEGGDAVAYKLHTVPRGETQRARTHGPEEPGPWASVIGLAGVIDNHGGSARHTAEAEAAGLLVRVAPGDVLVLDGERYRVEIGRGVAYPPHGWVRNGYPVLLHEEPPDLSDEAAEADHVRGLEDAHAADMAARYEGPGDPGDENDAEPSSQPAGLYVVKASGGALWTVVTFSAREAAELVIRKCARELDIPIETFDADDYEVGRLGDYEPGITGARIMAAAGGVIG